MSAASLQISTNWGSTYTLEERQLYNTSEMSVESYYYFWNCLWPSWCHVLRLLLWLARSGTDLCILGTWCHVLRHLLFLDRSVELICVFLDHDVMPWIMRSCLETLCHALNHEVMPWIICSRHVFGSWKCLRLFFERFQKCFEHV